MRIAGIDCSRTREVSSCPFAKEIKKNPTNVRGALVKCLSCEHSSVQLTDAGKTRRLGIEKIFEGMDLDTWVKTDAGDKKSRQ